MAKSLGVDWGELSPRAAWDELRSLSPMHHGMTYERLEAMKGIQWPCLDEDDPGSTFLHGRLWEEDPQKRRSEEHTSELQSLTNLVCRLLLEKKKPHISLCVSG